MTIVGSYHFRSAPWTLHVFFNQAEAKLYDCPKQYRFAGAEVVVKHFGNGVLLLPVDDPWKMLEAGLAAFEPGFELTRQQPDEQIRADIKP